jgi:hypothetical protein
MLFPVFRADGVRSGLIDLVGSRSALSAPEWTADRVVKLTDMNPPNANTIPTTADFSAEGISGDAAESSVSTPFTGGTEHATQTRYYTANGFVGALTAFSPITQGASAKTFGLPGGLVDAGDVHEIFTWFRPAGAQTNEELRYETSFIGGFGPVTQSPLDPIANLTPTLVDALNRLYSVTADVPSGADKFVQVQFSGGGVTQSALQSTEYAAPGRVVGPTSSPVILSPLGIPHLTTLPGFPLESLLPAGDTDITMEAGGWSGVDRPFLFPSTPPRGLRMRQAFRAIRVSTP